MPTGFSKFTQPMLFLPFVNKRYERKETSRYMGEKKMKNKNNKNKTKLKKINGSVRWKTMKQNVAPTTGENSQPLRWAPSAPKFWVKGGRAGWSDRRTANSQDTCSHLAHPNGIRTQSHPEKTRTTNTSNKYTSPNPPSIPWRHPANTAKHTFAHGLTYKRTEHRLTLPRIINRLFANFLILFFSIYNIDNNLTWVPLMCTFRLTSEAENELNFWGVVNWQVGAYRMLEEYVDGWVQRRFSFVF